MKGTKANRAVRGGGARVVEEAADVRMMFDRSPNPMVVLKT